MSQPARASFSAVARPMPRAAPVMSATFPANAADIEGSLSRFRFVGPGENLAAPGKTRILTRPSRLTEHGASGANEPLRLQRPVILHAVPDVGCPQDRVALGSRRGGRGGLAGTVGFDPVPGPPFFGGPLP